MTDAPSLWPALAAFAAVIALIPVALWVLKRLQAGPAGAPRAVTLVGGLTLGPRERIAIVEAQGRRWMIGVTGQSISMLAELERVADAPVPPAPPSAAAANPFGTMLEKLKRHG